MSQILHADHNNNDDDNNDVKAIVIPQVSSENS